MDARGARREWLRFARALEARGALVEAQGMRVTLFAMRELCEKGGGASRCLVSHSRLEPGSFTVPEENRLATVAALLEAEG